MPNGYKLLDIIKAKGSEQNEGIEKLIYNMPIKMLQPYAGISDEALAEMLAMVNKKD